MSKIICITGAPDSGKTTAGLKLAQEIYLSHKTSVIFLSPDLTIPSLGFLFPNRRESELYSLGKALDRTDICKENVLQCVVPTEKMENFGYLGFKAGEDEFTYPRVTADKISSLFHSMKQIANYIIVDCSNDADDLISSIALTDTDTVIQLYKPDLKTMVYYSSNASRYAAIADRSVGIVNISEWDVFYPVEEVKKQFKSIQGILPYSIALKQQSITGALPEILPDSKYRTALRRIMKGVL